jgi:Na+/melibiose symporter-like transporter
VFVLNGIASAVPATLVLFFVQRPPAGPRPCEPLFLASYFAAGGAVHARCGCALVGALGAGPRLAGRHGAWRWRSSSGPPLLGAGDVVAFTAVCVLSGVALGADLAVPGAMLAGVIAARRRRRSALEGGYFGWWNFATKLNLALAAGLALPLLRAFGYAPGAREPPALQALTMAYCLLPCVLKLAAGGLLHCCSDPRMAHAS